MEEKYEIVDELKAFPNRVNSWPDIVILQTNGPHVVNI